MLIGVRGAAGAGKDTVGRFLVERHGFRRFAFGDQLKAVCRGATGDDADLGWNGVDWTGPKSEAGRRVLQCVGHNARLELGEDTWTRALTRATGRADLDSLDRVVVTDVRYPNEIDWVYERRGWIVLVTRPDLDTSGALYRHPTESSLDGLPADFILVNNGDLEHLAALADGLMRSILSTPEEE